MALWARERLPYKLSARLNEVSSLELTNGQNDMLDCEAFLAYTLPSKHGTWKGVLYGLVSSSKGCFSGSMLVWGSVAVVVFRIDTLGFGAASIA